VPPNGYGNTLAEDFSETKVIAVLRLLIIQVRHRPTSGSLGVLGQFMRDRVFCDANPIMPIRISIKNSKSKQSTQQTTDLEMGL
jgi:hypothetical protein